MKEFRNAWTLIVEATLYAARSIEIQDIPFLGLSGVSFGQPHFRVYVKFQFFQLFTAYMHIPPKSWKVNW